jgi:ABC-type phosphate transport system ATPase subunit
MMDQGAVVEVGKAEQIFTSPQQERTRLFLKALR